jgi:non-heme chloroperoxidase
MSRRLAAVLAAASAAVPAAAAAQPATPAEPWRDPSPHQVRFVTVAPDVKLEVLDWGGTGRALVLLAGSGHSAHVYDDFAPKLAAFAHVYGITRRGFGASSQPETGYDDQRLADDVLAVIDALRLEAPVLIGHSMAGGELTTLGRQHSDRLGGLVYLDALGDPRDWPASDPSWKALEQKLPPSGARRCDQDRTSFAALRASFQCGGEAAYPESDFRQTFATNADGSVGWFKTPGRINDAIGDGQIKRDYSGIRVPVLAIRDRPRTSLAELRPDDPQPRNDEERANLVAFALATKAFMDRWLANLTSHVPGARVVDLDGAGHYPFLTRAPLVVDEIRTLVSGIATRRPG